MRTWLVAWAALGWLLVVAVPALAEPGIALPESEDAKSWAGALRLAGLSAAGSDGETSQLRLESHQGAFRIVAVAADGRERQVVVDRPTTEADREAVAFLARGLLREVLRSETPPAAPRRAPAVPADKASGSAGEAEAVPARGMTEHPVDGAGTPTRVLPPTDALRLDGTDDPDAPIGLPEEYLDTSWNDAPPWGHDERSGLAAPPLWIRVGAAHRGGIDGAAHLMAGTELLRKGRVRFNLEVGGVVGRDLAMELPRRLGHFDVEGSATVALLGAASVGAGLGTSYRVFREQGAVVDRQLVPTAQLRIDVPLVTSRKLALVAHVQGKLDLARTELVQPNGQTTVLNPFEIQPALVLRYHGALDLLSDYRRRR